MPNLPEAFVKSAFFKKLKAENIMKQTLMRTFGKYFPSTRKFNTTDIKFLYANRKKKKIIVSSSHLVKHIQY